MAVPLRDFKFLLNKLFF